MKGLPKRKLEFVVSMIHVLIADDHDLVRESIRAILTNEEDIEIVATARDGKEAVELSDTHHPDVVVMDISMPKLDGIRSAALIHMNAPSTRVIILSMHLNATLVQQAIKAGVHGYVLKNRVSNELSEAIHAAYRGEKFFSPSIPPSYLSPV